MNGVSRLQEFSCPGRAAIAAEDPLVSRLPQLFQGPLVVEPERAGGFPDFCPQEFLEDRSRLHELLVCDRFRKPSPGEVAHSMTSDPHALCVQGPNLLRAEVARPSDVTGDDEERRTEVSFLEFRQGEFEIRSVPVVKAQFHVVFRALDQSVQNTGEEFQVDPSVAQPLLVRDALPSNPVQIDDPSATCLHPLIPTPVSYTHLTLPTIYSV